MFGKLQDALLAKDDEEDERLAAMEAAIAERERERRKGAPLQRWCRQRLQCLAGAEGAGIV